MYFRIVWWMLATACIVVMALQLRAAAVHASSPGYETLAFIALFGLWALPVVVAFSAMSGWRWRELSVPMRWIGGLVPTTIVVLSVLAWLKAA